MGMKNEYRKFGIGDEKFGIDVWICDWIYDMNFDEFGERVIFGRSDCEKCLIFVGKMGLEWVFCFE